MTALLAFLSNPLRAIGSALVLILAIALGTQTLRLAHMRVDLVEARAEITSLQADIKILGRQIADQNTAIAALKAAGDEQAVKAAKAKADAESQRKALEKRLAALRRAPVPKDCPGAVQWLGEQGRKQAQGWEK